MILKVVFMVILGYIFGSIPFSYLFARGFKGIDIRKVGSGNLGAANVFTQVGILAGVLAGAGDLLKGLVPVILALSVGIPKWGILLVGMATVSGHNWPIFLRFSGGQGLATSIGVILPLLPREFGVALGLGLLGALLATLLKLSGWFGSRLHMGGLFAFSGLIVTAILWAPCWELKLLPIFVGLVVVLRQVQKFVIQRR
jgi:acyl-phosphate glycerol 3-phosphate acyltransferase